MWTTILSVVFGLVGKIFGIGKSDTQAAQEAGEKQGQAETKAATDEKIIQDVSDAQDARRSVRDAPANDLRSDDGFRRD